MNLCHVFLRAMPPAFSARGRLCSIKNINPSQSNVRIEKQISIYYIYTDFSYSFRSFSAHLLHIGNVSFGCLGKKPLFPV